MRISNVKITAAVVALTVAATAGCAGGGDKAGGEGGVRTLRLGTADPPGRIGSEQAVRFAAEVRRRSGGRLRVTVVWQANVRAAGGFKPGWDQTLAALVRNGTLDLGLVPARAWDTLGVTSLQALQAPFLVTSTELAEKVVRGPAGQQMLDGLKQAGVVGLALLPEEIRHPVAFGRPLRGLTDYKGRELRVPRSDASFALMRALGARPVDLNGGAFSAAVSSGRVTGAESSLALASSLPGRGTVSSNVNFYAKVNTLVVDRESFDRLPGEDRDILRDAASATLEHEPPTEAENAATACTQGIGVTAVSTTDLAGLEVAARPVYAKLERDAATRALIERIRVMKAETATASDGIAGCAPREGRGGGVADISDPSILNGVYRYELTKREMLRAGIPEQDTVGNYGVTTNTLRDGRYTSETRSAEGDDTCRGTYTVAGRIAEVTVTSAGCSGHFQFRWSKTGDGLRVTGVRSLPAGVEPAGLRLDRVLYESKPWRRIAG